MATFPLTMASHKTGRKNDETQTAGHPQKSRYSQMRKGNDCMNAYEEKQEARRERYLEKAEQARAEASERRGRARKMGEAIPFGQPILVGHHSEKSDRAYRNRMNAHYDKAMELDKKAAYYEQKAESVGRGGISSDDPDAIEKLTEKMEKLKKSQETMRNANRAIRMKDTEKGNAKLREMGFSDAEIKNLREPDFCGRIGFPAYALQNNNANIHRIEDRIKDLQRRQEREAETEAITTDLYEFKIEDNRCQFIFDGKPDEEVRAILKGHAFKWSPSRGAWVRQASGNGIYAAKYVREKLDALAAREGA